MGGQELLEVADFLLEVCQHKLIFTWFYEIHPEPYPLLRLRVENALLDSLYAELLHGGHRYFLEGHQPSEYTPRIVLIVAIFAFSEFSKFNRVQFRRVLACAASAAPSLIYHL